MALTLTLDDTAPVVSEPGYSRTVTSAEIGEAGDPTDQSVWLDPLLSTLMLKPRQLDPSWLGTSQQIDSIIRLDDMYIEATDLSSLRVIEAPLGNNADPWIRHHPVAPLSVFPSAMPPAPGGPPPGTPSVVAGIPGPGDIPEVDVTQNHSHDVYEPLATVPPAGTTPTPVVTGNYADAKTIAQTQERLPENAGLLIRWFHPYGPAVQGFQIVYVFHVGQYAIHIRDVTIEVWEDVSPHGDRSVGRKVLTYPMFQLAVEPGPHKDWLFNDSVPVPQWYANPYRALMWLPYRRNKVLLLSSMGRSALLTTRADTQIKRNAADTDWVNVRSDTLRVKVLSPVLGHFQVQRLKYASSGVVNAPISVLDYTPAAPPTLSIFKDSPSDSSLTGVRSSPPSYTLTERSRDDCPSPTASSLGLVSEQGVVLTLTASSDLRRSPEFYSFNIDSPRTLSTSGITPLTVDDTGTGAPILEAFFSVGMKPGEGKGRVELLDVDPYSLDDYYYRSQVPVRLKDGATTLFVGMTEPIELTPLHVSTTSPRRMTLPVIDRWKLLARRGLREYRDYNGVGHITAVLRVAELAGIDTTGAETPPINTTALNRRWNTPLRAGAPDAPDDKSHRSPWATKPQETAASFIQRVAEQFSGWDVGFRADGTFFYLPKEYLTATAQRFYASVADATAQGNPSNPLYRDIVQFQTVEPEALVIMVKSGRRGRGGVTYSRAYVDWAAIRNPLAPNYLGHWRAEVVEIDGGFTCSQLEWVARTIWNQTRRRHRTFRIEAEYDPTIKVGAKIEVYPYGDYRVKEINAHYQRSGWKPATYFAEFIEAGF